MSDELHKEVIKPPAQSPELASLKRKIDNLQILYIVLFGASIVLLLINWQTQAALGMHVLWGVSLGGAVLTRVGRSSLVAKYNSALLGGGPAPLS